MLNQEFNTWQQDYTEKIRRWVPAYDELILHLASLPKDFHPADILDLGSGNGNTSAALLEQYPAAHYTLVDASEEMIEATRHRFAAQPEVVFKEKYFQELNFLSNSFDLIVAGLSLHHLKAKEKEDLFKQLYRWLRLGGRLSISDLFASKENLNYTSETISSWEAYAKKKGTSDEEWDILMEHHKVFDFPSTFEDHIIWLEAAGFKEPKIVFVKGDWGTLQVVK